MLKQVDESKSLFQCKQCTCEGWPCCIYFFSNMTSMTSTGPVANSVFVPAPHNRYPMTLGGMSQVPVYPLSQTQVHSIPGNAHGVALPMYMQPAQRTLKEGKVLGVSEILHCRPGVTWLESGDGGGLEIWKPQIQQVVLELTQPYQTQVRLKAQLCSSSRASVCGLVFSVRGILGKRKRSSKLEHWSCCQNPCCYVWPLEEGGSSESEVGV